MNEQIDWGNAPEWATKHGLIGMGRQPIWFNKSEYTYVNGQQGGRVFLFDGPGYPIAGVVDATERPTTPSWSGEGLPPVGVVCEVEYDDGRQIWHEAEVIYHKKDGPRIAAAMLIGDGRDKLVWVSQFRPIRTPEQIAADEREAAVDAMVKACPYPGSTSTRLDCESLYSAGYRKP